MTVALRKNHSPRSRRYQQPLVAKNPRSKVTYLPSVSPAAFSSPLPGVPSQRVYKKSSLADSDGNMEALNAIREENLRGKIANLGNPWAKPIWLRSLQGIKTGTAILMLILVGTVIGLYGKVVHTKQNWGQEYRQLEKLQKEERQVTIFNEALKNNIAQTAKKDGSGLVIPSGSQMIVLEPTPVRPWKEIPAVQPENIPSQQPLGY